MLAHPINDSFRTKDVVVVENVTFESLLLSENVLKGLTKNGFKKPSPIQLKAIPVGRCGFDLIVKSKSGTGKTLVFSIIALESLQLNQNKLKVLVLSPTREIAVQSQEVIKLIGSYFKDLNVESFIGGLPLAEDKEKCKKCHIAVGTPGRIKQLINEKALNTSTVQLFVLDEADKLMEQSFRNDINEIYNNLPTKKQIITTSATYPNQLDDFLSKYMLSPTHITAELDSPLLLGLKQFVVITKPTASTVQLMKVKTEELVNIFTNVSFTQCLVFSNYQTRAESLSNILNQKGWPSTYISAAQSQTQRLAAVGQLKEFKCRIMLSTDLTARGIDAANVDLVINYDIPIDAMIYLHRMGRAGRYGSTGVCINLASEGNDLIHLQKILGSIGGPTLSIPKLTTFNGSIAELLKIEIPLDEHIYGTINAEQKIANRTDILALKKEDDKNIDILNILNESKCEAEEIKKHISDMDTESILNSLLNQDFKMETTSENNDKIVQECVMKTLMDSTTKVSTKESVKSSVFIQENKTDTLLAKNNALLNISKILSGSTIAEDSIEQHLSILKSEDKKEIGELSKKTTTDLLTILTQNEEKASTSKFSSEEDEYNVQNIFQFGYKNIVKSRDKNWEKKLTEIIKIPLVISENLDNGEFINDSNEDDSGKSIINSTTENNEEYIPINSDKKGRKKSTSRESYVLQSYDETSEDSIEQIKNKGRKKKKSSGNKEVDVMKWIPVEKSEDKPKTCVLKPDTDDEDNEKFMPYFEECSNGLWQNGLSFDNVDAFDEWFYYEWEAQLYSVRNYVQQNVYVSEMAKYQNSK